MQQPKHVSVLRLFELLNIIRVVEPLRNLCKSQWLRCCRKSSKVTEDKALAAWLDLTEEEQTSYSIIVDKLRRKLAPFGF